MKKIVLLLCCTAFVFVSNGQVLKRLGDRAKNKLEQKAGDKVDKSIDNAVDGKGKTDKEAKETTDTEETVTNEKKDDAKFASHTAAPAGLQSYSKYDFIQGEKVIAYEDFSNAEIGDFPTRWNTDGSAEVVTLNQKEGKWLRINNRGKFLAEFINNIPDNSTLEFDLGVNSDFAWQNGYFDVELTSFENREAFARGTSLPTVHFQFHPMTGENYTGSVRFSLKHGPADMSNEAHIKTWDPKKNLFAHVAIWRQGQRMRMYVNGAKLFDLPKAFVANAKYTEVVFEAHDMATEKGDYYLLSNIRLATGAPDTRNKLVTEGRFVTSGITFDVNSDRIRPDSYGVLKEIASVLKDNESLKIRIIGHTDSDGEEAANLELSKKRAAAVRAALSSEFGISADRMQTDGKGESTPATDNKTVEGKAQNRRVEFVKES